MLYIEKKFSQNSHWKQVKQVLKKLHQAGFQAFLVGGCVRDALLKREIHDFDIATSASPKEVLSVFPRALDVWKKYGVVFLPLFKGEEPLQITTFREEHSYEDGRRPSFVSYSTVEKDAQRRDFTINAFFYSIETKEILDFTEGKLDLNKKIIRAIGEAHERFKEDKLRPLRALRFAHQLEFSIHKETQKSIILFSKEMFIISKERIYKELIKMFSVGRVGEALKLLDDYQFFNILFPPFKKYKNFFKFWNQKFSFYKEADFIWALIGLPYYLNDAIEVDEILKTLKAPRSVIKGSLFYVRGVRDLLDSSYPLIKKFQIIEKKEAQIKELTLFWAPNRKDIRSVFKQFESIKTSKGTLPKPLITSDDLRKKRISKKKFGVLLNQLFEYQIENGIKNKKEILKYLEKFIF